MHPRSQPCPTRVRTLFLATVVWTVISAVAGVGSSRAAAPDPLVDLSEGPVSLVIIGLDTFRADELGCYGNEETKTPALDAFAEEAVLFEDCGSTSTWTLPAFASVFTGLYPHRHGSIGGGHGKLGSSIVTLAEILLAHDYRTHSFVAVDFLTKHFGLDRGFERHGVFLDGPVTGRLERYQKRLLRVPAYLGRKPWFLFVHYFDAHDPYQPPAPYDRMYYEGDPYAEHPVRPIDPVFSATNRVRRDPKRRYQWLAGVRDLDFPVKQYAAGITYVDHHVGTLLDALRAAGQLDRSIVVVLGDHGEHLTEHSVYFTHLLPYEECLRVPLMIRLPRAVLGGTRIEAAVSLVDVLPTLLELMGMEPPTAVDGLSLVPLLQGKALPQRVLFAERGASEQNKIKAVWNGDYRLIDFQQGGRRWLELYDRRKDRAELHDLSGSKRVVRERLVADLDRVFGPERRLLDVDAAGADKLDPEVERRLRALGYID